MPLLLIPAVAILAGLLALLIIQGYKPLANFIGQLVPSWHIPGLGNLRDVVIAGIDGALAATMGVLDAAVGDVWKVIGYPVTFVASFIDGFNTAFSKVVARFALTEAWAAAQLAHAYAALKADIGDVLRTAEADISHAYDALKADIGDVLRTAEGLVSALRAYLLAELAHAYAALKADIADAIATAEHLADALRVYLLAQLAAAVTALRAEIATVDAFAHAAYTATLGKIADALRTAEHYADAAAHAAETAAVATVETAVTDITTAVWPDVVAGIEGAIDAAGDGFTDIVDALRDIDLAKVADLAGVAALTGTMSLALTRYLRECGMPNCRNLSGLGRDLQALFGMVEDAAFLALCADMVHDPAGAARATESALGGLAADTLGVVKGALGVA